MQESKTTRTARPAAALRATLAVLALTLVVSSAVLLGRAYADPGSKEDPLATVSYVQKKAQFTRRTLPGGAGLRLGIGAELIVVDPPYSTLEAGELDTLRDQLVDLTAGRLVDNPQVETLHHYINGSSHDVFLRFEREATVLVRGEWK